MDPFTHTPKPNTRIPPILLARHSTGTSTTPPTQPQYTHLATLSKQKLRSETSTGDPDLRRCIGHHRLLRRSIQEAQEDMKRYLDEVLESDSGSEEDDEEDDEGFESIPTIREKEVAVPLPRSVPLPVSATASPLRRREKIVGAMRRLVKRRPTPTPVPLSTAPPPRPTSTPPSTTPTTKKAKGVKIESATLIRISAKNASCSNIPIKIHIHEHITGRHGLERSHSDSDSQSITHMSPPTPMAPQAQSITLRRRKYAERLGLKRWTPGVSAAVGVVT
ncbi:hypothetical protein BDV12DRAFT_200694 [Aspergillus spectabilis]